jgi:septal ring factor EnvC (AmiA/AmiB activator)
MKKILCLIIFAIGITFNSYGQSNSKVKELEMQRNKLELEMTESKRLLSSTQKDVDSQLAQLSALTAQIKKQKLFVNRLDADVRAIDNEIKNIEEQMTTLKIELERRRKHYAHALQLMSHKNSFENRLMFLLSANSFNQMIRRMRYLREYSEFQQKQGEELMVKQKELDNKRIELKQTYQAKKELLAKRVKEKQELDRQEAELKKITNSLKKKQENIRKRIAQQQREHNSLNEQIERIIEAEIAKQETTQRKKENKSSETSTKKSEGTMPAYRENAADKKLSGSFESNKGKLPIPITGPYLVTSHYGVNYVQNMKNVKFNNHGIDIRGQKNCYARSVFDGTVSYIFEHPQIQGSYIVMIRHGQYISAYFHLTALKVKTGDKVKINQQLGTIRPDISGNYTMQFQLRHGTQSLDPSQWIKL